MKTLEEIKNEYATEDGFESWDDLLNNLSPGEYCYTEIAERYAEQFKPKWIPVEERLPEFDKFDSRSEKVYIYNITGEKGEAHAYKTRTGDIFWAWANTLPAYNVTHWQPLPAAPEIKLP